MRRFSFIAAFLLAVLMVMAGVNYPLLKKRKKGGAQTAAMKDSLPGDSVTRMAVDTTKMDSLQLAIYRHNQAIDDSIHLDSIGKRRTASKHPSTSRPTTRWFMMHAIERPIFMVRRM